MFLFSVAVFLHEIQKYYIVHIVVFVWIHIYVRDNAQRDVHNQELMDDAEG